MKDTRNIKTLTVSCLAPLMPRIWLKPDPLAAGAFSGAFALTAKKNIIHSDQKIKKGFN